MQDGRGDKPFRRWCKARQAQRQAQRHSGEALRRSLAQASQLGESSLHLESDLIFIQFVQISSTGTLYWHDDVASLQTNSPAIQVCLTLPSRSRTRKSARRPASILPRVSSLISIATFSVTHRTACGKVRPAETTIFLTHYGRVIQLPINVSTSPLLTSATLVARDRKSVV